MFAMFTTKSQLSRMDRRSMSMDSLPFNIAVSLQDHGTKLIARIFPSNPADHVPAFHRYLLIPQFQTDWQTRLFATAQVEFHAKREMVAWLKPLRSSVQDMATWVK